MCACFIRACVCPCTGARLCDLYFIIACICACEFIYLLISAPSGSVGLWWVDKLKKLLLQKPCVFVNAVKRDYCFGVICGWMCTYAYRCMSQACNVRECKRVRLYLFYLGKSHACLAMRSKVILSFGSKASNRDEITAVRWLYTMNWKKQTKKQMSPFSFNVFIFYLELNDNFLV